MTIGDLWNICALSVGVSTFPFRRCRIYKTNQTRDVIALSPNAGPIVNKVCFIDHSIALSFVMKTHGSNRKRMPNSKIQYRAQFYK